ncbi:sensor histidine kinase [Kocuria sp. M1R5S2]|uniref:sensor histidine kinase n=1 Tax=Kocuria rhizosphaerae TaxID=3376285 RepID=UPI00379D6F46
MRSPAVPVDGDPDADSIRSAVGLTLAGWGVGLLVTALVLWSPYVLFGYRNPLMHVVLDSVDACVALLAAYLLHGRFLRRGRVQDLLLAQGLVLLAVAGLGLTALAEWLSHGQHGTLDVWLPLVLRVAGAVLITAAAVVRPGRRTVRVGWPWTVVVPAAVVVTASAALWTWRDRLPSALWTPEASVPAVQGLLTGHPVLVTAQAGTALCFAVASLLFSAQAARRPDPLLHWLGPACALAAFARVNYALFPSLYTDWLYAGDVLRTGFYLLLLVGALREIEQYWNAYSRAAVLEDRRRLARELHDGVVQELSLIRMAGHGLPPGAPARERILGACDRALDEARAAVHALGHGGDETLGLLLHRAAREMAQRHGVRLEVVVDEAVDADPEQRHALVRIAREAVTNAVRHGRAERLCLRLARDGDHSSLVVEDDGTGFDVGRATGTGAGYGLISMRERARSLPGALEVRSEPGVGSEVTVTW